MSGTSGRYLKRATRCVIPGVIFAAHVTADARTVYGAGTTTLREWRCASVAVSYRRRVGWTAPQTCWFSCPDAMRAWMAERALRGRLNWVIADRADEFLTLSQWWTYAERKGIGFSNPGHRYSTGKNRAGDVRPVDVSRIAASSRCTILDCADEGIRWRYVGACNYWPDGGPDIGAGERPGLGGAEGGAALPHGGTDTVRDRALAIGERFRRLCGWWHRVATAPLGVTAGQCAIGVLRSHTDGRSICSHGCDATHRVERAAAHGGRATTWFAGRGIADSRCGRLASGDMRRAGAPYSREAVTLVDVQSMYPTILRDELFPVARVGLEGPMPPARLVELAGGLGVIARVTMDAGAPEYPLRKRDRIEYPLGRMTTTLAGPEILAAARDSRIVKVHCCAVYRLGRPFRDAMQSLLNERARAEEAGDRDAQTFAKLCANSLAGKLSQNQGKWQRASKLDTPGRWGEDRIVNAQTMKVRRVRYLCGAAFEWSPDETGRGPYTAAFAYLTAYGRCQMRTYREMCPPKSVVSQDTDGMWVLPAGISALIERGALAYVGPGRLRIVDTAHTWEFLGPRHYRVGDRWVLSGFRAPVVDNARLTIGHSSSTPMLYARHMSAPSMTVTNHHETPMVRDLCGGTIGEDGWILPPRYLSTWREDD